MSARKPAGAARRTARAAAGAPPTKIPLRKSARAAAPPAAARGKAAPSAAVAGKPSRLARSPPTARKDAARRGGPADLDPQALLAQAERAVQQAVRRGAAQAECYLEAGAGLDVELEKGHIAGASSSRSFGGSIRVIRDGRLGFAYFTQPDGAPAAIEQALRASRLAPADGYTLPAGGRPGSIPGRWDARVAALDVADAVRLAQDVLAGAREACPDGVVSGGGVGLTAGMDAIASSEGAAACGRETSAGCHAAVVLQDGGRSVSAYESQPSHRLDLDALWVGREAGARATSLRAPQPAGRGGRRDVLLRPHAASELVVELVVAAVHGDDAVRGRTLWPEERLGESVADARLHLADDPFAEGAVGASPYDDEGVPTRTIPILARGKLRSFLFDSRDAHRNGRKPTASAVRSGFKSRPETGTHHLVASASRARPLDKLVAGIDDGILVDQLLGAHTANSQTGEFSVTSPAAWRIRKGDIVGPVQEVALAGSLPKLLEGFGGASREARQGDGERIPHMLFHGLHVSV